MILVCDRDISQRAIGLRERIFAAGLPAAVSAPADFRRNQPYPLMVTFTDFFDDLRRSPYSDAYCLALGPGFVNSALKAAPVRDEAQLLPAIRQALARELKAPKNAVQAFGTYLTSSLFFGTGFIEIRGRSVLLTGTEFRILYYLAACSCEQRPAPVDKIVRFCMPSGKQSTEGAENRIAAHVYGINQKVEPVFGGRMRYEGYYALKPREGLCLTAK